MAQLPVSFYFVQKSSKHFRIFFHYNAQLLSLCLLCTTGFFVENYPVSKERKRKQKNWERKLILELDEIFLFLYAFMCLRPPFSPKPTVIIIAYSLTIGKTNQRRFFYRFLNKIVNFCQL